MLQNIEDLKKEVSEENRIEKELKEVKQAREKEELTKGVSFYPLPSNDEYEKFLQKIKKDQCTY